MISAARNNVLILRENSAWLRYVFFAATIGMLILAANTFNAPEHDVEKIILSLSGALLLGFCGFALPVRRIVIDPLCRTVAIGDQRIGKASSESIGFDEIKRVLVLTTSESVENLQGAEVQRQRRCIALSLDRRTVQLNRNLYVRKSQALREATRIQQVLGVDLVDSAEESIAALAQGGRRVEAVVLATRVSGKSTGEAKAFADDHASPERARRR